MKQENPLTRYDLGRKILKNVKDSSGLIIKLELVALKLRQIRMILCAEVSIYMLAEKMRPRLNVNYCGACQVF